MLEVLKTTRGKLKRRKFIVRGSWINLVSPDQKDLRKLQSVISIPDEAVNSLRDIDEVSTIERYDDFLFLTIRTPRKNVANGEASYSTVPLGIIIADNYLVTICFWKNDVITALGRYDVRTAKRIQTVLKILLLSAKTYLTYLKEIHKQIYSIQKDLEREMKNEKLFQLLEIEKALVYFNTSLKSNQLLVERLTRRKVFTQFEEDRELLEDVMEEHVQAIETTRIYTDILAGMMDAFASIISNNLNAVMKLLTSVTLVLMLPTLVASIYGMNIALPFQRSPDAFLITMGISAILSLAGALILWRKDMF